jgi:hypothetical protein
MQHSPWCWATARDFQFWGCQFPKSDPGESFSAFGSGGLLGTLVDTDGDGFSDSAEVVARTDPTELPALGPWGVGVLVALLSVLGIGRLRRRTG